MNNTYVPHSYGSSKSMKQEAERVLAIAKEQENNPFNQRPVRYDLKHRGS